MGSPPSRSILSNLTFTKTSEEIRSAVASKLVRIRAKITERELRITNLRASYEITDADMIQLLSQQARDNSNAFSNAPIAMSTYSVGAGDQARIVGAGVVQNLVTEQSLIEQEREQIERLEMIHRNLRPISRVSATGTAFTVDAFEISHSDLEFLGF